MRERFSSGRPFDLTFCKGIVEELRAAVAAVGRDFPIPAVSDRLRARMEKEAAVAAAIAEQAREEGAVAALEAAAAAAGPSGAATAASPLAAVGAAASAVGITAADAAAPRAEVGGKESAARPGKVQKIQHVL